MAKSTYLQRKSKYSLILFIGNKLSNLAFVVTVISFIMGIVSIIGSFTFTQQSFQAFALSIIYAIVWFVVSIILYGKHKEEVQTEAEKMADRLYKQTKDKIKVNIS